MPNEFKEISPEELKLMVKKLRFLDKSNNALIGLQDKIERMCQLHYDMILSHDIRNILEIGLSKFHELIKTEVCSVYFVDEKKFEFVHKISIPATHSVIIQQEIEAQIKAGTFGWVINNGLPTCVPAEVIGKESNQHLSVIIAPLSNKKRTIGVVIVVFEQDSDFIRQQTLKLLYIIASFLSLSLENAFLFTDLKQSYFDTIRAVANSVEARDPYTRGHSQRVGKIAKVIAGEFDWDQERKELIDWGAVLHDVGKIGIPDSILNKPSRLTNEEYSIIKNHPRIGAEIVKEISFLKPVMYYILEHHERFDGKGYPRGLDGKNISIEGRILAIADTYDAMTSNRPYRNGMEPEVAIKEILNNAGTQFDPQIVDAFHNSCREGRMDHLLRPQSSIATANLHS